MRRMEQTKHYINVNGDLFVTDQASFSSSKRIIDPDSVFESMRYHGGQIIFEEYHKKRLQKGLTHFGYRKDGLKWSKLREAIEQVVVENGVCENARIRLTVERVNQKAQFAAESWALGPYSFNDSGLQIDLFDEETKTVDEVANFKKGNYLNYVSAINFAKAHHVDDVVTLNNAGKVCESTVSNIFWIKNGTINTIPLSEGPVAGVLREFLLEKIDVQQKECTVEELLKAEEVFLTNVIRGIQPVKKFRTSTYADTTAKLLFKELIEPLTNQT